jgi:hypothetical protein
MTAPVAWIRRFWGLLPSLGADVVRFQALIVLEPAAFRRRVVVRLQSSARGRGWVHAAARAK